MKVLISLYLSFCIYKKYNPDGKFDTSIVICSLFTSVLRIALPERSDISNFTLPISCKGVMNNFEIVGFG